MIETLFGSGDDLTSFQMGARALGLFALMLLLVRIAGRRMFSSKSSFDIAILIMLGAVLSRVITGASPAVPTMVAAVVLCVVHRLVAMLTVRSPRFEAAIKGPRRLLYRDGVFHERAMLAAGMSRLDLEQAARSESGCDSLDDVHEVIMERSGQVTVRALRRDNAADVTTRRTA